MYSEDLKQVLNRYRGRCVTIQTYGGFRFIGDLIKVHESAIRLANATVVDNYDDSRWYGEMSRQNREDSPSADGPEATILLHQIVAISCDSEDYFEESNSESPPTSEGQQSLRIVTNLPTLHKAAPLLNETNVPDVLEVHLSGSLIRLAQEGDFSLVEAFTKLRSEMLPQLGFCLPQVRIRDKITLPENSYEILVQGHAIAKGEVHADKLLAMMLSTGKLPYGLQGIETEDPVFGFPGMWVDESERARADSIGATLVPPGKVLAAHMEMVVKNHRAAIYSYQIFCRQTEELREKYPQLIQDCLDGLDQRLRMYRLVQSLLAEGVNIRNLPRIIEAACRPSASNEDYSLDDARMALLDEITSPLRGPDGRFETIWLESDTCEALINYTPNFGSKKNAIDWDSFNFFLYGNYETPEQVALIVPDRFRHIISYFVRRNVGAILSQKEYRLVENKGKFAFWPNARAMAAAASAGNATPPKPHIKTRVKRASKNSTKKT